ncbi:DUF4167 domain-containing protein [Methyloceanibacter sp.]|uniref:DUF4167 domain-containing protein n=1 Tax=Methyloceanibacter sp. TaxID=1965321 RepID=UPI003D6CCEB7
MRQGQQNRRGRGRGRKPQNPLARNYESNGPDVKIRGTAVHVAEKYMSLARDALASGDMIAAESYFQHAEHYNRIIMAAQSQFGPQHGGQPGEGGNGGFRPRWNADGSEDDGGSDFDSTDGGGGDVRETHGGGGQDRERHAGNREHHGGGRDNYGRRGPNGGEGQGRDTNGSDPADAAQSDESTSDPVG